MKRRWWGAAGLAVILAGASGAFAQQRSKGTAGRRIPEGVKVLRDLAYVKDGHKRQKLDLYLPEKAERPLPLIVWIHGGGWREGDKAKCPIVEVMELGYAVASVNYRLSQDAVFPAQIEDCKAAIRWLRAHAKKYGLDPDRVGVWGASAGGHLVALLGTTADVKEWEGVGGNTDQSSRVQCVLDWFGRADFEADKNMLDNPDSSVAGLLGGTIREHRELARQASPVTHVGKDSAPFLIMHGDRDQTVPFYHSQRLTEALKKAGVEVELIVVKGGDHGGPGFVTPENRKRIEEFFAKHLKPGQGKSAKD